MKKTGIKNPYLLLIALLLGSFILFLFWSGREAALKGSRITDPAYYSKGLRYNNTEVEMRAASTRGWQLQTDISGHQLQFQLHDSDGRPITRATGQLIVYLAKSNRILNLATSESLPGSYQLALPAEIQGSLQAHVEFEQQGARISRQLLINL